MRPPIEGGQCPPHPRLKKKESENPLLVLWPKWQWEIITFHRPLIHSQALRQFNQQCQCDLKIPRLERAGEGLKKITLSSAMLM